MDMPKEPVSADEVDALNAEQVLVMDDPRLGSGGDCDGCEQQGNKGNEENTAQVSFCISSHSFVERLNVSLVVRRKRGLRPDHGSKSPAASPTTGWRLGHVRAASILPVD